MLDEKPRFRPESATDRFQYRHAFVRVTDRHHGRIDQAFREKLK